MTFADRIEKACGHPVAFYLFTVLFVAGVMIDIDTTNIAISYFTAALLLLTLGPSRRSNLAIHAKLDDMECAIKEARSENVRLEEKTEREIEETRK